MDPPLVMEYATSLTRYCDDNLLSEHSAAASSVMFDNIGSTQESLAYSLNKHLRSSATTRQAHFNAVRYRQPVATTTARRAAAHAVGDSHKSPLDRAGAASALLRVAAHRRRSDHVATRRCDGAGTAARRADGRSLLAAPPMAPRQRRRRPHRDDRWSSPVRAATAPGRATVRHRARTRRQHHTSPALPVGAALATPSHDVAARSSVPHQLRHHTATPRVLLTSSVTSLRVAARPPRWLRHCSPTRAALPAPRQLRHRTSSHVPPRWRRVNYVIARRRPSAPPPQLLQPLHTVPVCTSTFRNRQQPQPHFFN